MNKIFRIAGLLVWLKLTIALSMGLFVIGGCTHERDHYRSDHYTGSLFYNPKEMFPIDVRKASLSMAVSIGPRDTKMLPSKRSELQTFLHYYRDQGIGRIQVSVPRGAARRSSVQSVLRDMQYEMEQMGFGPEVIKVRHYSAKGDPYPSIQLSFKRHVAVGPECSGWNENWGQSENNWNSQNWGCANQNNLAAMVANPRDLKGPRGWSPRDSRRRDVIWDKFVKGDSPGAVRSNDERVDPIAK